MARRRPVHGVSSHVLVSCLVARDLNELNGAEHCDPDQLKDSPNGDDQGKGVSGDIVTQSVINNVALCVGARKDIDV